MKQLIRLFVLPVLLFSALAACAGGEVEQAATSSPAGSAEPVVQVYHPPA